MVFASPWCLCWYDVRGILVSVLVCCLCRFGISVGMMLVALRCLCWYAVYVALVSVLVWCSCLYDVFVTSMVVSVMVRCLFWCGAHAGGCGVWVGEVLSVSKYVVLAFWNFLCSPSLPYVAVSNSSVFGAVLMPRKKRT